MLFVPEYPNPSIIVISPLSAAGRRLTLTATLVLFSTTMVLSVLNCEMVPGCGDLPRLGIEREIMRRDVEPDVLISGRPADRSAAIAACENRGARETVSGIGRGAETDLPVHAVGHAVKTGVAVIADR